jgi:glucose-fructose oxidoreductase
MPPRGSGHNLERKALGARYGVPAFRYEDLYDVLARADVDAVYVALPNTLHEECAVRAARAGVHVLTEKPMATSEKACRRMIDAAKESDVKLMVAYRLHFERSASPLQRLRMGSPRSGAGTDGPVRHRRAPPARASRTG